MTDFTEAAEALRAAIAADKAVADECYGAKMAALDKLDDAVEAAWAKALAGLTAPEARA
jgi:hypothetical protein